MNHSVYVAGVMLLIITGSVAAVFLIITGAVVDAEQYWACPCLECLLVVPGLQVLQDGVQSDLAWQVGQIISSWQQHLNLRRCRPCCCP